MDNTLLNIYSEPFVSSSQYNLTLSLPSPSTATSTQVDGDDEEKTSCGNFEVTDCEGSETQKPFDLSKYMCRASELADEYISTGCPKLDSTLKGGIPAFGMTELYGEAGSGKTQLCLQIALLAQLPKKKGGLNAGVLYICTEEGFPTPRLSELALYFGKRFPSDLPNNPMDNIFVEHMENADDLLQCVDIKLDALTRQSSKKIRLVILDSVAGVFRTGLDDLGERTMGLRQLGQTLHEFSHQHKAAILVCNQVTADMNCGGNVAALGLCWKNLITTRIQLSKFGQLRSLEVSFSPHIPSIRIPIQLNADGIRMDNEVP